MLIYLLYAEVDRGGYNEVILLDIFRHKFKAKRVEDALIKSNLEVRNLPQPVEPTSPRPGYNTKQVDIPEEWSIYYEEYELWDEREYYDSIYLTEKRINGERI